MKTVTFYSYKGGVGRTLALSNVASRLAEFGKSVCIIDFDLEAPGVPYKFKVKLSSLAFETGLVDYLHHYIKNRQAPTTIADFVVPIQEANAAHQKISLLPAGNTYSRDYWVKLSSISWDKFFYEKDSTGVAFFFDLKEKIKQEIQPDYLLIDSRTGITEIAGITLSLLADEVVLLSVNNEESLDGTEQVLRTILQTKNPVLEKAPKIHFVMSRLPLKQEGQTESPSYRIVQAAKNRLNHFLKQKKLDFQLDKVLTIHSEPDLQIKESLKIAYADDVNASSIGVDYLRLFEVLTMGDLTEDEKQVFKRRREYEKLKGKILISENESERIQLLKQSLKEYKEFDELFIMVSLAEECCFIKEYEQALKYIKRSLEIQPNDYWSKYALATIYLINKNNLDEALDLYLDLLETIGNHEDIIRNVAAIYILRGNINKGFNFLDKLMTLFPPSAHNFNAYANALMKIENYKEALNYIYKALELKPNDATYNATMAEIQSCLGNDLEFYRNVNLALEFGFTWGQIKVEPIYQKYLKEPKFIDLLARYDIFPEEEA